MRLAVLTMRKYTTVMVMELFAHRDYIRVLSSVRRKPKRFGQLQKELGLNPAQVDRALKYLRKGLFIIPRVEPSAKGRLLVEYEIGKRGAAFLDSFSAFSHDALRRRAALGDSVTAELKSFTQ
jgi:DNA-binding HxlR family transcriptional regulator